MEFINLQGVTLDTIEVFESINDYVYDKDKGLQEIKQIIHLQRLKQEVQNALISLNSNFTIHSSITIHSNRFPLGVFIKKIILRMTQWYFDYIIIQQNNVNSKLVHSLNTMEVYVSSIQAEQLKMRNSLFTREENE